jgi:nucleotide-binding universal stress UspA family protein
MVGRSLPRITDDILMGQSLKYFLLTVDESPDALWPVGFLGKLYHRRDEVGVLICYFYAPLAPVYQQPSLPAPMAAKKEELLRARMESAQAVFHKSRMALMETGFLAENIQEHMQERSVSQVQHSCSLAVIKRVDGVLVQKSISGKLEGLLRGDPFPAHLQHCVASPIWFLEGRNISTERAAICMYHEQASLRAVRHAASMLADSETRIDLVHCDPQLHWAVTGGVDREVGELHSWEETPNGQALAPYLQQARQVLSQAGIAAHRIRFVILPVIGNVANSILGYCRQHDIGIAILGHSKSLGPWGFFQNSVTKEILRDFKNMSVWVVQQGIRSTDEDSCC